MKVENRKCFIIKRLSPNGTEKDVAIDEDEIRYVGSRFEIIDKAKKLEFFLKTVDGDTVIISKQDYEQLRDCIGNVTIC